MNILRADPRNIGHFFQDFFSIIDCSSTTTANLVYSNSEDHVRWYLSWLIFDFNGFWDQNKMIASSFWFWTLPP